MRDVRKIFATSLRQLRRVRHLNQAQLAEAASLSVDMIGRLERGTVAPSFDTLAALSEALGVAPVALFGAKNLDFGRTSERVRALAKIDRILSGLNDADVSRMARIVGAYAGE